jgi:hypothetical protein
MPRRISRNLAAMALAGDFPDRLPVFMFYKCSCNREHVLFYEHLQVASRANALSERLLTLHAGGALAMRGGRFFLQRRTSGPLVPTRAVARPVVREGGAIGADWEFQRPKAGRFSKGRARGAPDGGRGRPHSPGPCCSLPRRALLVRAGSVFLRASHWTRQACPSWSHG